MKCDVKKKMKKCEMKRKPFFIIEIIRCTVGFVNMNASGIRNDKTELINCDTKTRCIVFV